ncbi:hypothetical protein DOY81_010522 [Sarcophaga bullata]|nr:hypothetical protein DOY81_010522 [Sarcophaga bullata]
MLNRNKAEIKTEIKDEVSSLSTLDEDSQATALENEDSISDVKPKEKRWMIKKMLSP